MHCREWDSTTMGEMWYGRTIPCNRSEMWAAMLNDRAHTEVVTLIWVGFWSRTMWGCFRVNRLVWELVSNPGDGGGGGKENHSEQNSGWIQTCVFCKHKQSIKPQPRKILRHIRSPKREQKCAKNQHKPNTHPNMTPAQLCSARGNGNQKGARHVALMLS